MVPQATNHAPERKTRRERRIEILAERRRIKQIMKKLRPVTFDNNTVTEAGNFQFLARFKELIGLDALIESHVPSGTKSQLCLHGRKARRSPAGLRAARPHTFFAYECPAVGPWLPDRYRHRAFS